MTSKQYNLLPPSGPVVAELNFYSAPPDGAVPFTYVNTPPPGEPQFNYGLTAQKVLINDVRDEYKKQPPSSSPSMSPSSSSTEKTSHNNSSSPPCPFTLDENAFTHISNVPTTLPPSAFDPSNDAQIKAVYYPETEQLILAHVPGAKQVIIFDHTIRRASTTPMASSTNSSSSPSSASASASASSTQPLPTRKPVTRVHIDQTPTSALTRLKTHLPADQVSRILGGTNPPTRYRIINVWRPLNGPVHTYPLAIADGSSVHDEDIVAIEHRYPDWTGETAGVKFGGGGGGQQQQQQQQRWWYVSGMRDDEVLMLECADSEGERVKSRGRAPHAAFVEGRNEGVEGVPMRESVEVRALVIG